MSTTLAIRPPATGTCTSTSARVAYDATSGTVYLLTACCAASGKGGQSPTGVVCRACYQPVPGVHGDCATLDEATAWVTRVMTTLACPCPQECAEHIVWDLTGRDR